MKIKKESIKEIKKEQKISINNKLIYRCEKCGYESSKTFLNIFEDVEYRYCLKCVCKFYENNFPKAILLNK